MIGKKVLIHYSKRHVGMATILDKVKVRSWVWVVDMYLIKSDPTEEIKPEFTRLVHPSMIFTVINKQQ